MIMGSAARIQLDPLPDSFVGGGPVLKATPKCPGQNESRVWALILEKKVFKKVRTLRKVYSGDDVITSGKL